MRYDNKREFSWFEMAIGFVLLFMYCVVVVFWQCVFWVFNLPARAVKAVRGVKCK